MKPLQIIIEGVSETQIQKTIEKNTKGWRLFFIEPEGTDYLFMKPFWGYKWDGTAFSLKEIIKEGAKVGDKHKHHICLFKYNGEDKFAWCSWTREVLDINTKIKYQLEQGQLARQITDLIMDILEWEIL